MTANYAEMIRHKATATMMQITGNPEWKIHTAYANIPKRIANQLASEFFLDPLIGFPKNTWAAILNLIGKKTTAPCFHARSSECRKKERLKTLGF